MAVTQKGTKALLFGVGSNSKLEFVNNNTTHTLSIISSMEFKPTSDEVLTRDNQGAIVNLTEYEKGKDLTVTAKIGNDNSSTNTLNTWKVIPTKGDSVNITDDDTQANGTYIVRDVSKRKTPDGHAEVTFTLHAFENTLSAIT